MFKKIVKGSVLMSIGATIGFVGCAVRLLLNVKHEAEEIKLNGEHCQAQLVEDVYFGGMHLYRLINDNGREIIASAFACPDKIEDGTERVGYAMWNGVATITEVVR